MNKSARVVFSLLWVSYFVFAVLVSINSLGLITKAQSDGSNLPLCPSGMEIVEPFNGKIVSGISVLKFAKNTLFNNPATQVVFRTNATNLGSAYRETTTSEIWRYEWDTSAWQNNQYELRAVVTFQNIISSLNGNKCQTTPVFVNVQNSQSGSLDFRVIGIPSEWTGPTSVATNLDAIATVKTTSGDVIDVTPSTSFQWTTNIGSLSNQGDSARFFSGSKTGIGEVKVTGTYGNLTDSFTVDIKVTSQTDSTYPSQATDDNTDSTETDVDNSNQLETEMFIKELDLSRSYTIDLLNSNEGDSRLVKCFSERLDEAAFQRIANGGRLTFEELKIVRTCFVNTRYIVPVNIAPLAPELVSIVTENDSKASIKLLRNIQGALDGEQKLEFSGTSVPDTEVLLYVFSEPVVFATKSDGTGNWTYTLEDPLEPGNHEVYAVVQDGEEYVRSASVVFALDAVQASEENPNGYSLVLARSSTSEPANSLRTNYLIGAGFIVMVVYVLLYRFVWFKNKHRDDALPQTVSSLGFGGLKRKVNSDNDIASEKSDTPST